MYQNKTICTEFIYQIRYLHETAQNVFKVDLKFTTCECYKSLKFVDSGEYMQKTVYNV